MASYCSHGVAVHENQRQYTRGLLHSERDSVDGAYLGYASRSCGLLRAKAFLLGATSETDPHSLSVIRVREENVSR